MDLSDFEQHLDNFAHGVFAAELLPLVAPMTRELLLGYLAVAVLCTCWFWYATIRSGSKSEKEFDMLIFLIFWGRSGPWLFLP